MKRMTDEIFNKKGFREALKELYKEYGIQACTTIATTEKKGTQVFLFGSMRDRYSSTVNAIRHDQGVRNVIISSVTAELVTAGVMNTKERMDVLDGVYKQLNK